MKKNLTALVTSAFLTISGFGVATAQDAPQMASVELYVCNYNDRQGPDDLSAVVDRWNRWMDETDAAPYMAVTLTPNFVSAEQDFDFLWLGRSPNFAIAGAGQDHWLQNGGSLAEDFAEVSTCDVHVNVASMNIKAPPSDGPTATSVLTITNCTVHEGRRMDDVVAAAAEWTAHRAENGSTAGTWMWFPVFGGGDVEFDFSVVNVWPNHTEMGKEMQWYMDNQQWNAWRQQFAGLVDCNVPRVYDGRLRRAPQPIS